jgi:hypothetical protein
VLAEHLQIALIDRDLAPDRSERELFTGTVVAKEPFSDRYRSDLPDDAEWRACRVSDSYPAKG